jgi:hypothetical protein
MDINYFSLMIIKHTSILIDFQPMLFVFPPITLFIEFTVYLYRVFHTSLPIAILR